MGAAVRWLPRSRRPDRVSGTEYPPLGVRASLWTRANGVGLLPSSVKRPSWPTYADMPPANPVSGQFLNFWERVAANSPGISGVSGNQAPMSHLANSARRQVLAELPDIRCQCWQYCRKRLLNALGSRTVRIVLYTVCVLLVICNILMLKSFWSSLDAGEIQTFGLISGGMMSMDCRRIAGRIARYFLSFRRSLL